MCERCHPNARTVVSFGSCLSALVWVVGWPFATSASLGGLANDAFYEVAGLTTAAVGLLLTPTALVAWSRKPSRTQRLVATLGGLAVGTILLIAGSLVFLGAVGKLGERAPSAVLDLWGVSLAGLVLWIAAVSVLWRRVWGRELLWPAIAAAAAWLTLLASSVVPGSVVSAGAIGVMVFVVVSLAGLAAWAAVPVWLVLLGVRLRAGRA